MQLLQMLRHGGQPEKSRIHNQTFGDLLQFTTERSISRETFANSSDIGNILESQEDLLFMISEHGGEEL